MSEKPKFGHNPEHHIGTCSDCGEEMVWNVPRLGSAGGFVHKNTGKLLCHNKETQSHEHLAAPTLPDPKPEQLWRDLDDEDVISAGDRYKILGRKQWRYVDLNLIGDPVSLYPCFLNFQRPVTLGQCSDDIKSQITQLVGEATMCWEQIPSGVFDSDRALDVTNRILALMFPTPGQCDCAGLREAASARILGWSLEEYLATQFPATNGHTPLKIWIHTLDRALAQPCTCAGKSAEELEYQRRTVSELLDQLNQARRKLADLEEWRRQQLEVESQWDAQEVGRLIGVPWGQNIRPAIQPFIENLQRKLAAAEKDKMPGPLCDFCQWTNVGCLNIGEPNKPKWICHSCVKLEIEETDKAPAWRSYDATPPTEQDGVKIVGYDKSMVLCSNGEDLRLQTYRFRPYGSEWGWTHVTFPPLPKLPQKPEQDADEDAFEKWWNSEERTAFLNAKLDCEQAWQAALDFARNQERL